MRAALAVGVLSAAGVLVGLQPAGAASNTVLAEDSTSHFEVKPSVIGYTGDATGYLGKRTWGAMRGYLKWTRWNSYSASGVGTVWLNNCRPSCSNGGWSSRKGWVQLGAPKRGKFTVMTITYRRGDRMVSDTRRIRHVPKDRFSDGYWIWTILNR